MNRLLLKAGALAFLLLFALFGCGSGSSPAEKAGQKKSDVPFVRVQQARITAISDTMELTGSIVAAVTARLATSAEGPIRSLKAREGDVVRKGATLLVIGRSEAADSSLLAAKEDFVKEQEELKAIEALVGSGALPGEQLDKAKANFARAKAQLIRAQETVGDYVIRAPFNGVVSKVNVTEGFYVAPRTVLVEMFDPGSLVLQFAVPEAIVNRVAKDTRVEASLDASPGKVCRAAIRRVYPDLDLKTRSRLIEADCAEGVPLVPGMFARVKLFLRTVPDALVIPAEALVKAPDGSTSVYLVAAGKALKRKVKAGIEEKGLVQVVEGVNVNDRVVVTGQERLKDGVEVKIAGEKEPAAQPGNKKAGE